MKYVFLFSLLLTSTSYGAETLELNYRGKTTTITCSDPEIIAVISSAFETASARLGHEERSVLRISRAENGFLLSISNQSSGAYGSPSYRTLWSYDVMFSGNNFCAYEQFIR